jgi:hypothetical protein
MASFTESPFAALTIVVAPAILTNASSVLCLGTGNRLARVADRARAVSAQLARLGPNGENHALYRQQLEVLDARFNLVLRALTLFYMSLASFAAAALISLLGSIFAVTAPNAGFVAAALLGLLSGMVGVAGLVAGCAMMVQETRLAVQDLRQEAQRAVYAIENHS